LKEPFAWTEFALGGFAGVVAVIMREKDAMIDPNQAATDSIGSGPFKFNKAEWVPGSKVVYDKNADYVPRSEPPSGTAGGKVVKVDRVEYKVIPEAATQANAIIAGEVDFLDQAAIDIIPTVERNRDIVIEAITPLANYGILRPNHLHPPFNNPKARQALAYLMDQKDYAAAAFGPQKWWRECYSYFICDGPYGTEVGSEAYRKPDLAKAKQLLAEAGYKGEKIVIIGASDLPALNALTQVTTAKLKEIGVNVDLVMSDWGGVVTRRSKKDPPEQGGWHIFHTTWGGAPMASPLTSSSTNTACDGRNWFGWPCDEAANKLRDQFIRAANPAEQKAALEALHKRLWEAFPFVLTGQYVQPQVWRKNVTGVLKANTQVWWNIDKN
jgi:peptide/nickel transport system substrate-binding protein